MEACGDIYWALRRNSRATFQKHRAFFRCLNTVAAVAASGRQSKYYFT